MGRADHKKEKRFQKTVQIKREAQRGLCTIRPHARQTRSKYGLKHQIWVGDGRDNMYVNGLMPQGAMKEEILYGSFLSNSEWYSKWQPVQ